MLNVREILTLQFGNYSNYIGTHWWNIQESGFTYDCDTETSEICHDVLYRQGINDNRQITFTPRLLLLDLEGSLKHLPQEGELYGSSLKRSGDLARTKFDHQESVKKLREDLAWKSSDVEMIVEPESVKNEFQLDLDNEEANIYEKDYNLAQNVDSWTDFAYARYHPRTVHVIKQYNHNKETETFDTYSSGVQLWKDGQFEEEFCDRIRQYVEECDFLQGFQTICDAFNGFAGLAGQCLEHLNDEYGKANVVIPVYSPRNTLYENADLFMSDSLRVVNSVLLFHRLAEQASVFIPLSIQDRVWRQLGAVRQLPHLDFIQDNLYQTSAILASYLDTITLRYRLKNAISISTVAGFCADLNNYGRKLAAAGLAIPFPMNCNEDLIDCLDKFEGPLFTQLTPNCHISTNYVVQSVCIRGIPIQRLKREPHQAKQQMRMPAYRCQSVSEMFQLYLQCINHASLSHVTSVKSALSTRVPYPIEIFDKRLNTSGFINTITKRLLEEKIQSVPCLAIAQSSSEIGDMLESLHKEAKRVKISKLCRFKTAGLEDDDYVEALEGLLLFKDNYEDNFEL
uniref:Protein misato n=1 Tax=Glossina brevipalpis TaxID=37001 RepID=A0A1A9WAZ8_9MUSC